MNIKDLPLVADMDSTSLKVCLHFSDVSAEVVKLPQADFDLSCSIVPAQSSLCPSYSLCAHPSVSQPEEACIWGPQKPASLSS